MPVLIFRYRGWQCCRAVCTDPSDYSGLHLPQPYMHYYHVLCACHLEVRKNLVLHYGNGTHVYGYSNSSFFKSNLVHVCARLPLACREHITWQTPRIDLDLGSETCSCVCHGAQHTVGLPEANARLARAKTHYFVAVYRMCRKHCRSAIPA